MRVRNYAALFFYGGNMKKKHVIFLLVAVALTFGALSSIITGFILKSSDNGRIYVDNNEYQYLMKYFEIGDIADLVKEKYYSEVSEDEITEGALIGSVDVLSDGYSRFYPKEDYSLLDDAAGYSFIGQGLMLKKTDSGYFEVTKVFADTAGFDANVLKGDVITKIDGRDTRYLDLDAALSRLRGKSGTEIKLELISADKSEPIEISFMRRQDNLQLIFDDVLDGAIGYISVIEFGANAKSEFLNALETLSQNGAKKLIIDLRGVPGGYISAATDAADLFLTSGTIATQYDKTGTVTAWTATESASWSGQTVILTDSETAGAAEVFAAALKENSAATIIGTKTAAKGCTLKFFDLGSTGDGLRLITGGYYTPSGSDLAKNSVLPDTEVSSSGTDAETDAVLQAAIEYFNQ